MKRQRTGIALAAVLLIAATGPAGAQQPATAPASDLDPAAVAALGRMGTFLRSVKAFRVTAATTRDRVLETGQVVQSSGSADILAEFPSRLRIDNVRGLQQRMFLYDGKSFTMYGKVVGYYATVPASPTIGALADVLADTYGIELPLEDLFLWGTDKASAAALTSATDIGPADVQGTSCEQYAFRQDGLDWQVWIQLGSYPLPRKLVITTTSDDARPQYSATYKWDLAPAYNDAAFTFDPPEGARKIPLATVGAKAGN